MGGPRRDGIWIAVVLGITILGAIIQGIVGLGFMSLIGLALLVPNAAMTARRLQDTGKDGKLVWILFIPMAISGLVTFLTAMTFGAVVTKRIKKGRRTACGTWSATRRTARTTHLRRRECG